MRVQVTLWGNLRRFAPEGRGAAERELSEGATIEDLVADIGAQHEVFAASVNGRVVALTTRLALNDRVFLFDHLHGG